MKKRKELLLLLILGMCPLLVFLTMRFSAGEKRWIANASFGALISVVVLWLLVWRGNFWCRGAFSSPVSEKRTQANWPVRISTIPSFLWLACLAMGAILLSFGLLHILHPESAFEQVPFAIQHEGEYVLWIDESNNVLDKARFGSMVEETTRMHVQGQEATTNSVVLRVDGTRFLPTFRFYLHPGVFHFAGPAPPQCGFLLRSETPVLAWAATGAGCFMLLLPVIWFGTSTVIRTLLSKLGKP